MVFACGPLPSVVVSINYYVLTSFLMFECRTDYDLLHKVFIDTVIIKEHLKTN